jgi:4a-hydroxytetrahydrobiopterin dehydratase
MKPVLPRQQLQARRCRPLAGDRGYAEAEIQAQLATLPGWSVDGGKLERSFVFGDFHDTMAFVNALAWMIHGEDHHPELVVTYNRVTVRWETHSVGGISENDFICAAKTDAVFGRNGN